MAERRATYEDILAAPPLKIAEIVEGVLHLSPEPFESFELELELELEHLWG